MRVAILADRSGPFYEGGVESRIWNLARQLASRHEVRIFTTLDAPQRVIDGVTFIRVAPPLNQPFDSQVRSRAHELLYGLQVARKRFDGWHADVALIESIPFIHILALRLWARQRNCPIVLTVDEAWSSYSFVGTPFRTPVDWMISALLRMGVKDARRVVAVSRATARSLEEHFDAHDVSVVPCGVNLEEYRPFQPATPRTDPELDVVSVGRLEPIKRHADLIRALAIMHQRYGWSGKAVLIGEGSLMPRLLRLTRSLGIDHQVQLPGYVERGTRCRLVASAKLFVLPSEREGFSISTLEAQASGVPAIVAQPTHPEVFGVSEVVTSGVNGEYFPVGDASALADQMWSLLNDPARRTRMSQAALSRASAFDWKSIGASLEGILFEAADGGPTDRPRGEA